MRFMNWVSVLQVCRNVLGLGYLQNQIKEHLFATLDVTRGQYGYW